MKYLIACLFALGLAVPVAAQEATCDPNIVPLSELIAQADAALTDGDVDAALELLSQAKGVLEVIEASCVEFAEPGSGESRLNPVPFGQRQRHEILDSVDASIEITSFEDDANERIAEASEYNDPPEPGMKYVVIEFDYYCEFEPDRFCDAGRFDYKIVGANGLVYEPASGISGDFFESTELFGGGQMPIILVYMVAENDTSFVLMNNYDDSPVYWATE